MTEKNAYLNQKKTEMLAFERDETKDYNKKPCCKCKYVQECQKITSTKSSNRGNVPNAEGLFKRKQRSISSMTGRISVAVVVSVSTREPNTLKI
jgi:hypothetical protein